MRTTMSAVIALTAAGVVLTAGTAYADASPTPGGWTVTGDAANPWNPDSRPWTAITPQPTDATSGRSAISGRSATAKHSSTPRTTGASSTPVRRRHVSRDGLRLAVGCQSLRGGVWAVRPGDTLWRVSICTHRDLDELVTVNRLPQGGRLIFPGDRITVLPQ